MRRLKYKLIGTGIIQCLDAVNVGKRYATFTLRLGFFVVIPLFQLTLNLHFRINQSVRYTHKTK